MTLGRLASSNPKIGGPLRAWVECFTSKHGEGVRDKNLVTFLLKLTQTH
jgi:hypothetical protein